MREIKFRAWDKSRSEMIELGNIIDIADYEWNYHYIKDNLALMQFTGLRDKNGKEIYEGDIVKNERGEIGQVVFNNGAFVSQYLPPYNWDPMEPCDGLLDRQEVIGNIYENSELVKSNG